MVTIKIQTDQFGGETSWQLKDFNSGTIVASVPANSYGSHQTYSHEICIPEASCMEFTIFDSFGDGIEVDGKYAVLLDSIEINSGNFFRFSESTFINCNPGTNCIQAFPVSTGTFQAIYPAVWFQFTPDSTGTYFISTCEKNSCDTQIWIYDDCEDLLVSDDQTGAIYFDSENGGCNQQAQIPSALFETGKPYYIRIGGKASECGDTILFSIRYNGPLTGCTDPASCNYDPFASADNGSCLAFGDPGCPGGPDLMVNQLVLKNSIFLDSLTVSDLCMVEEGCVKGPGKREVLRFTTHIANIGDQDFYLGKPADDHEHFSSDNCHQHFHYNNYAEYVLFDSDNEIIPAGFKSGFCLADQSCEEGSIPKYSCANMGLTAGCRDVYLSNLDCQWIDITGLSEGLYTFAVRINWNNHSDLVGRTETDTLNNWAQVCFRLLRPANGPISIELTEPCAPYLDCEGHWYGTAVSDCEGVCRGERVKGDINGDKVINESDLDGYLQKIVDVAPLSKDCYDLNADDTLSVLDAVLLADCIRQAGGSGQPGNNDPVSCDFQEGWQQPSDSAAIYIEEIDYEGKNFIISVENPTVELQAWQYKISGAVVLEAENLADGLDTRTYYSEQSGIIAGLIELDTTLERRPGRIPLLRIHYGTTPADSICIEMTPELISNRSSRVAARLDAGCFAASDPLTVHSAKSKLAIRLFPNPFSDYCEIRFYNPGRQILQFDLYNTTSKLVRSYNNLKGDRLILKKGNLPAGLYFFRLQSKEALESGKLVIF